ncbi:MAG: hypothetical protein IPJ27_24730 [Candidatus Accumulibacter sp.]|uniref:Uncharacterized protein n=1 Tax=Candidatus Accumulibacter proximus TaxID=2954385 RepID=A0A935Q5T1_9PROT|nr:hypothetical protein [Candidatus Accumulibacter proximus]
MSDNVDDPVLEQLRALRGGRDRIESESRELAARLASLGTSSMASPPKSSRIRP